MVKCLFNTYSIHCGTEFMERLHKCLQYFIIKQQSHDPAWQKVEVILSGHRVSIMTKGNASLNHDRDLHLLSLFPIEAILSKVTTIQ